MDGTRWVQVLAAGVFLPVGILVSVYYAAGLDGWTFAAPILAAVGAALHTMLSFLSFLYGYNLYAGADRSRVVALLYGILYAAIAIPHTIYLTISALMGKDIAIQQTILGFMGRNPTVDRERAAADAGEPTLNSALVEALTARIAASDAEGVDAANQAAAAKGVTIVGYISSTTSSGAASGVSSNVGPSVSTGVAAGASAN